MDEFTRGQHLQKALALLREQGCLCPDPYIDISEKMGQPVVRINHTDENCPLYGEAPMPARAPDWFTNWEHLGPTPDARLTALLEGNPRPLSAVIYIYETFALAHELFERQPEWISTRALAQAAGIEERTALSHLHGTFQSDAPWAVGRLDKNEQWDWHWAGTKDPVTDDIDFDITNPSARRTAAAGLLEQMGVEIPLEEIAPSVAMMQRIAATVETEEAFLSLLHKPTPVWATARGFAWFFDSIRERTRLFRELRERSDQLTLLHCHCGNSMQAAHVLVMDAEQVVALPPLEGEEAAEWISSVRLPFDPFFLDMTGSDELVTFPSEISATGEIALIGVLFNSNPEPNVLFITPVFMYAGRMRSPGSDVVVLGSSAINLSDDRHYPFTWIAGVNTAFDGFGLTLLANSDVLESTTGLRDEYATMIEQGAARALACLYLIESSNVSLVERSLERRDLKRAEKRDWNIPLVVKIERPSRRTREARAETSGQGPDWTHQWDVIGHYMHFTKGPMVSCTVCGGRQMKDGPPCPRCHGTGLDPEKVSACTRRDVLSGEPTCPFGCRRIWCPSHVKGPEDRPYVPKSRKLK